MVLENLIPVKFAEKKPLSMILISFLYATVAIFLALWIFPSQASIVAVFLTTLAALPLFLGIIGFEKEKEEKTRDYIRQLLLSLFRKPKLLTHSQTDAQLREKVLWFFVFLLLGLSLTFAFWFVVLPQNLVSDLFHVQINTVRELNLQLSGAFVSSFFLKILMNNVKVLAFTVLFSFIYGAGAIFIIVWNASVIGSAMGDSIRNGIAYYAKAVGIPSVAGYTSAVSVGIFRFVLHGIPEVLAYFIGAFAGGLISVAVVKHEWGSEKFENTMRHVVGLIALAIIILVIAAVIEVTISPMITIQR